LKEKDKEKEAIRKEAREVEKQIEALKLEVKKGLVTVEERDKVIAELRKDIADKETKYNNLTD
jgi:hypothetical protein